MGTVPAYDPVPPPAREEVCLSNYAMQLVKVTEDHAKKGWEAYTIRLSQAQGKPNYNSCF